MIIQVAIPTPIADFLDYLPGEFEPQSFKEGMRVQVPFGSRQMVGIVVGFAESSDYDEGKLRTIAEQIDQSPTFPADLLALLKRAAQYYHHPLGEVLTTALPKRLRQPERLEHTDTPVWQAITQASAENIASLTRAKTRRALFDTIQGCPEGVSADVLREESRQWKKAVEQLEEEGLVLQTPRTIKRELAVTANPGPELNHEQASAVDALADMGEAFGVLLLEGVTGSGKTEVFMSGMERTLAAGRQVLILLPEIGLTPQLKDRINQRFNTHVVAMHSAMNQTERMRAWRAASLGEARIVLGTRSALFTPMPNLGLIIIDEEHDTSLKQQDGFRYHARDLGILRAQILDIPILLASATPSLETFQKSRSGQYRLARLTQRAGKALPPRFLLVDLKREHLEEGLSQTLRKQMKTHLEAGHQVLLFINRRGFAPVMLCHECGAAVECPHCDRHTTYHSRSHSLRCHHCGYVSRPPEKCPGCGSSELIHVGVGTERLELHLKETFDDYSVVRLDRDSMSRKDALETTLAEIREGKHQIIIGTQMLAKGHDFPNITLVGIIDVDQGLFSSELRSLERMGQQILQVGGRAGRGSLRGDVVMQTHQPDHPLLKTLLSQGYAAFAEDILRERQAALMPPFGHLAMIRCSSPESHMAADFLSKLVSLAQPLRPAGVLLLGPIPSSMEKRAGRYYHQLLILCQERKPLHQFLNRFLPLVRAERTGPKVRWNLDVDPMESV